MSRTAPHRTPRFFWQGVLILLPVAVLAGAGFISLGQDRALVQHEANEKAQALANECAAVLWAQLTSRAALDQFKDHAFRMDAQGKVVFPPPAPSLPAPAPANLSALDGTQRARWLSSQALATNAEQRTAAIEAGRQWIESKPPQPFRAGAQFRLGHLLAAAGDADGASNAFRSVIEDSPSVLTESGLAFGPLAELSLLEISARKTAASKADLTTALVSFCSNVVFRPSFITPRLLSRGAEIEASIGATNVVAPWREQWANHEVLRVLAKAALSALPERVRDPAVTNDVATLPVVFWFIAPDRSPNPQSMAAPVRNVPPLETFRSESKLVAVLREPLPSSQSPPFEPRPNAVSPDSQPVHWLASRIAGGTNDESWIVCRAMSYLPEATNAMTVVTPAWTALRASLPEMPEWFDLSAELAGVPLFSWDDSRDLAFLPSGKGGGQGWRPRTRVGTPEILSSALRGGPEALRVNIHLISPEKLFERQQTRSRLFGMLIALSVFAALTGFVSARRSFLREQQLSEMKSNFVSSVSHELRAPIASVRLMAESLDRGKAAEPAKQREYFRFIVQECRRLGTLIENVLDFARIEQGRKQYEFEPTDLAALVQQTAKLMEPAATERGVKLETRLPESDLSAEHAQPSLDASAMQQALINLLDNALKHSPTDATVTVALEFFPESSSLILSVEDRGPGIPAAEQEKIFERFYRRGSELRRETQGVGIGLSIVKHIVEAHGGRVRVESEVGQGSRFVLELPLDPSKKRK